MIEKATKDSWQNVSIIQPKRIALDLHFNERQFTKLTKGLVPKDMDDKWFIYVENNWIYMHRSWSGFGIYEAPIIKTTDGYMLNEYWVETHQERHQLSADAKENDTFCFLIVQALLKIDCSALYAERHQQSGTHLLSADDFKNLLLKNQSIDYMYLVKSALFGVAVGDALGVPVEFKSREAINQHPVTDMIGYGTYNLPSGTWSDDSSLTFCLAEALTNEFDLEAIAQTFAMWYYESYWTPRGHVFDIGIATRQAIDRFVKGERADLAGGFDESSNGNGSLMRILPLVFYLKDRTIYDRYTITKLVSSITHGHVRSVIACFYYLEFALQLLEQKDKFEVYHNLQTSITEHLDFKCINPSEVVLFDRLLTQNIYELPEDAISSSGYVLHTLEASIWCLLTTDTYEAAVLKAVNLGEDTDTTGAVTGGLAGLLYGYNAIPSKWIQQLARHEAIENLAERFGNKVAHD